jgi:hypothetical protein
MERIVLSWKGKLPETMGLIGCFFCQERVEWVKPAPEGWLTVTDSGRSRLWLCPTHAAKLRWGGEWDDRRKT